MSRRKIIFLVLLLIIQLCLIWPVYPLFSNVHPLILGIPFSFAWVIFVLLSAFLLVLWYYLTDPEVDSSSSSSEVE